jgi:hypothetical protein
MLLVRDPFPSSAPRQLSLFPDGHELQAQALVALDDLDVAHARRWLERARPRSQGLPNFKLISDALDVLAPAVQAGGSDEDIARVVVAVQAGWQQGRVSHAVAGFIDETVGRFWGRSTARDVVFLDADQVVHRGLLDLLNKNAAAAERTLSASLLGAHGNRADLWGYLGDANLHLGRPDRANACWVRALLLGANHADFLRCKMERLVQLDQELRRVHPGPVARERVLSHAWLLHVLDIPPRNDWLDAHRERLDAETAASVSAHAPARLRRFAYLLYLDRTQPSAVDVERREEMAALAPDLFHAFIGACAERERSG